jgi:hypothetical protein
MTLWSLSGRFSHFRFLATASRRTKFHLKSPTQWLFLMIFGLLQPYADDDDREAVYTLCLPVDDGVHCFTFSHMQGDFILR